MPQMNIKTLNMNIIDRAESFHNVLLQESITFASITHTSIALVSITLAKHSC